MSAKTKIEWTDATWNPVRGCSEISEGCRNCYAMRQASRFAGPGGAFEGFARGGKWTGRVALIPDLLKIPFSWKVPSRIFVNSMSDTFHEKLSFDEIDQIFAVMALCVDHTFQVLTKRPGRMLEYMRSTRGGSTASRVLAVAEGIARRRGEDVDHQFWDTFHEWPIPHVWLGVSVEDQVSANVRIPTLLQTPAAVRFVSAEPLLGAVDLEPFLQYPPMHEHYKMTTGDSEWNGLDWVIVGGESGPGSRIFRKSWVKSIIGQCEDASVPLFVKQLGAHFYSDWDRDCPGCRGEVDGCGHGRQRLKDRKGGDPEEWPEDLRVREFPNVKE